MRLLPVLALGTALAVAACTDQLGYYRGIGFTGINGEPTGLPGQDGGTVARAETPMVALAALPVARVQSKSPQAQALAEQAISHGGTSDQTAVPVQSPQEGPEGGPALAGMLSLVQVNGVPFAVILPVGNNGRLAPGADTAFGQMVESLTGCVKAGAVYGTGSRMRLRGLAVPVDCS